MIDKIPPQATELEEAVLAGLIIENTFHDDIIPVLNSDSFFKEQNKCIFNAIKELYSDSNPIDILTVTERLRINGKLEVAGGAYSIVKLSSSVANSSNIEYHAKILQQKALQRKLINISADTFKDAYDDNKDIFDVIAKTESRIEGIYGNATSNNMKSVTELLDDKCKQLASGNNGDFIPTSLKGVNQKLSGWNRSDLIIVAGRPAMGKTSYILCDAVDLAMRDIPVAIFSLEMSSNQLLNRIISLKSGIYLKNIINNNLSVNESNIFNSMIKEVENKPLYIDDSSSLSGFDLKVKARNMVKKHGVQAIFIDYLQLMNCDDYEKAKSREQELSYLSRKCKAIAKELHIPIIALSQLSRIVEQRHPYIPMLSHLKESGDIEANADIVIFVYRPEYYGIYEDDKGNDTRGKACLIVSKHRNGATGDVWVKFDGDTTKFYDDSIYSGYSEPSNKLNPNTDFDKDAPF